MKERNGTIDFFRFVFAMGIVFCHANAIIPFMPNGWIGVEFFFLVTGWLMCNKAVNVEHNISANEFYRYIKHKISGFYPETIVALVLGGGIIVIFCYTGIRGALSEIVHTVLDSLLLQVIIGRSSNTGGVMWYLSAMLWGTLVIYPVLVKFKEKFLKYAVFISVMIYGFMLMKFNTVISVWEPIGFNIGHMGLLRGIADMLMGCIAWFLTKKISGWKISAFFLMLIELAGYISVICLSCTTWLKSEIDFICIIILLLSVSISFSEKSALYGVFQNNIVKFLGGYSLNLYLNHIALANVFGYIIKNGKATISSFLLFVIFILISNLLALINMIIAKRIREYL